MKLKLIYLITFVFLLNSCVTAQNSELNIKIIILEKENIAEVNLDNDKFVKSFSKLVDFYKSKFEKIAEKQKIAILSTFHKSGLPTYEVYATPNLTENEKRQFINGIEAIQVENTKLVDFPVLVTLNCDDENAVNDFNDFETPAKRRFKKYEDGDIAEKIKLNKEYAINEVLPVLAAFQLSVDNKFEGVKNFGDLIKKKNFSSLIDIENSTNKNKDYWRATMEMGVGNQLIPVTKIFMLIAQGEFDYVEQYLEIINLFSDPKNISEGYLRELKLRLNSFNNSLNEKIKTGIALHDKKEFNKAIEIYETILKTYPNSAWALYEKYYSTNARSVEEGKTKFEDRGIWDASKSEIYKHNPLYHMDVRASNGKEGYLLFKRQEINSLFKKKEEKLNDLFKYAQIASDLGVYDFSAQLFWISAGMDEKKSEKAMHNFLYCIDKLGEKTLKQNFKGDFDKIFKAIDEEKNNAMKESVIYKSFKN